MIGHLCCSVVRLMVLGLLSFSLFSCTAQHTKEVGRKMMQDVGISTAVEVTRTERWSLPEGTTVYLAPVHLIGVDADAYPRLRGQLGRTLEATAAEWFQSVALFADPPASAKPLGSGVLVQVSVADAGEHLSSGQEMADRGGLTGESSGRDRLRLIMKIHDVGTGELLDTLVGQAVSGWQWQEHEVAQLAETTLRAMLGEICSRPLSLTP